jgi:hypothetical protein
MSDLKKDQSEQFGEEEIERRRDAALLRALNTPHKKQSEMKIGKAKAESPKKASPPRKRGRKPKPKSLD